MLISFYIIILKYCKSGDNIKTLQKEDKDKDITILKSR